MRSVWFLALIFSSFALLLGHGQAMAQSDMQMLMDRLDRLERDISSTQRMVARGASSGATTLTSPAAQDMGEVASDGVARLTLRITQLENQMRSITGAVEEAGYKASSVATRLDRMAADNELRFKELEQKLLPQAAAAQSQQGQQSQQPPQQLPPEGKASVKMPSAGGIDEAPSSLGAPPGVLGQLSASDLKKPVPATTAPAAAPEADKAAKPASPKEIYDQALALHNEGKHAEAEKALRAFLTAYGKDPLASSARYWLADTFYRRKDYDQAAVLFAETYQTYPKGNKAADSLLKLGQSFSALDKKREACIAFDRLGSEFPNAAEPVRRAMASERQKAGCK